MWLFLGVGLSAGVLAGLFGIGGGIVIVPALLYLAKMPMTTATGTSLGALLLPVGALGAWEYYRNGHLNIGAALLVAVGLFLGAWFGARLAESVSGATLRRLFAVFVLVVGVRMWFGGDGAKEATTGQPDAAAAASPGPLASESSLDVGDRATGSEGRASVDPGAPGSGGER